MIKVNSEISYLGKEIREWSTNNPQDPHALEVREKYYSDQVEFKPSDQVYYFIYHMSAVQSYKECGSLNMMGCSLHRDLEKSPRKTRQFSRKVGNKYGIL